MKIISVANSGTKLLFWKQWKKMRFPTHVDGSQICLLFITLLKWGAAQNTTEASNGDDNAGIDISCPPFRYLDTKYPNTPIYGAPDGCRCFDGLSGLNCGYCESDEACQMQDEGLFCRKDFVYKDGDPSKSYFCSLTPSMTSLLDNGKVSFHFNLRSLSAEMVVYNTRSVNDYHFVQCAMSDCRFQVDGTAARCDTVNCSCNEDLCDDTYKATVATLSGKIAFIDVDDYDSDQKLVSVNMEGSAFPIEALCQASSCTRVATLESDDEKVDDPSSHTMPAPVISPLFWLFIALIVAHKIF